MKRYGHEKQLVLRRDAGLWGPCSGPRVDCVSCALIRFLCVMKDTQLEKLELDVIPCPAP